MNELIPIKVNENSEIIVSGRELHEFLEVRTAYKDWFPRMVEYGFTENTDFIAIAQKRATAQGNITTYADHAMKLDMAKEISMVQRNEKGKEARQYFIQVEKDYNSPEKVMARALVYAEKSIKSLEIEVRKKDIAIENRDAIIESQIPAVIFADSVSTSKDSILVGEMAKILNQNGIETGEKRLYQWLRDNKFLISRKGTDWNMPTQKSVEMDLFEIAVTSINHSNGETSLRKTSKVTGKGQRYFVDRFLKDNPKPLSFL